MWCFCYIHWIKAQNIHFNPNDASVQIIWSNRNCVTVRILMSLSLGICSCHAKYCDNVSTFPSQLLLDRTVSQCVSLHLITSNSTETPAEDRVLGTGFHCSYLFRPHPVKLWVAAGRCLPRSLGWDRVSRHFKGTQVSSATRAVHVLLRLELDDRILWYKSIKVCVGRLSEALYLKWIWSSLSVYAGALECVPCHGDNLSGSECTWFQGQDVDKCFS